MRKNTLIPVVVCLMVSLLSGQDPVTSSSNFKDLPPVPRAIIEPPPLPSVKTSPKDLRRKTRVIKKKKTKSKKKSSVPRKVKVAR